MAVKGTALYGKPTRVTADVQISAVPGRLMAVQLEGGTDASSLDFHDALTLAGTAIYGVTAPCVTANGSEQGTVFIDLSELGGIPFATGCYCDWTGTAAVGYVWFG